MFCGKCGNCGIPILVEETTQEGNVFAVSFYGKCDRCGELLGFTEIYRMVNTETVSRENAKKVLDKHGKL